MIIHLTSCVTGLYPHTRYRSSESYFWVAIRHNQVD
uniref:Uncharacterized protein n=1 Tax=Stegastes partitus TaxID=144197 RepID=A0A3B5BJ96_9TELE